MKTSLFQIEQEYKEIAEQLIELEGEPTPELEAALIINQQNLETKSTNYGIVIKQMDYEVGIIDSEIKRLNALKKQRTNAIERLENNIKNAMEIFGMSEIKTPLMKLSFRKSESVEVENIDLLDKEFVSEKITFTADKTKIKAAIKEGRTVQGATLQINNNLQIK
jgi:hypothetical protein